jgi:quercetin dioxygenase-like cupin family protein
MTMDRATFEAELTRDGFEIVSISMQPDAVKAAHVHPFDARVLVVDGAMTVDREDTGARTFQSGEFFALHAGCRHSETAGSNGATYVAGRRVPAARR